MESEIKISRNHGIPSIEIFLGLIAIVGLSFQRSGQ